LCSRSNFACCKYITKTIVLIVNTIPIGEVMIRIRFLLLAATLTGCAAKDAGVETHPVTGQVLEAGKPIANATVVFHPDAPTAVFPKPSAKTDANGNFRLSTFGSQDGAPAGRYRVTVELWLAGKPDEGPSNRLPAKLSQAETSGLTATISDGSNALKPFDLRK
jgi:hypothetical protein